MTTGPTPRRLSDDERDNAVSALREHFEAGRLDQSEFTERMERALAARFPNEFAPLFEDLPDPHPSVLGAAAAMPAPYQAASAPVTANPGAGPVESLANQRFWAIAQATIWPVAILLMVTTGRWHWIILAIIASIVIGHLRPKPRRQRPPYLDR